MAPSFNPFSVRKGRDKNGEDDSNEDSKLDKLGRVWGKYIEGAEEVAKATVSTAANVGGAVVDAGTAAGAQLIESTAGLTDEAFRAGTYLPLEVVGTQYQNVGEGLVDFATAAQDIRPGDPDPMDPSRAPVAMRLGEALIGAGTSMVDFREEQADRLERSADETVVGASGVKTQALDDMTTNIKEIPHSAALFATAAPQAAMSVLGEATGNEELTERAETFRIARDQTEELAGGVYGTDGKLSEAAWDIAAVAPLGRVGGILSRLVKANRAKPGSVPPLAVDDLSKMVDDAIATGDMSKAVGDDLMRAARANKNTTLTASQVDEILTAVVDDAIALPPGLVTNPATKAEALIRRSNMPVAEKDPIIVALQRAAERTVKADELSILHRNMADQYALRAGQMTRLRKGRNPWETVDSALEVAKGLPYLGRVAGTVQFITKTPTGRRIVSTGLITAKQAAAGPGAALKSIVESLIKEGIFKQGTTPEMIVLAYAREGESPEDAVDRVAANNPDKIVMFASR